MRCTNKKWNEFIKLVANDEIEDMKWSKVDDIKVTTSQEDAERFYLEGYNMIDNFPLDRQWICPTNNYAKEMNLRFHMLRNANIPDEYKLGSIGAITEVDLEIPESNQASYLTSTQRFDFVSSWTFPDIPDPSIDLQIGQPMTLMRNLNTHEGIVKNRRCWIIARGKQTVTVRFEDSHERVIPRIAFNTETNGIKFTRTQIPFKPLYAGTIHKSQGLTLNRVVIDMRSKFWEHGQLYVALSRVKDPKNLCILLPKIEEDGDEMIIPIVDKEIVKLVKEIEEKKL